MKQFKAKRRSDSLRRYKGPLRTSDETILDQAYLTANGGSATMRVFDHDKEHEIDQPVTRLRSAVLAGGTSWEIPHFAPTWIENGDTIEVYVEDGIDEGTRWEQHVVTTVTPGTNQETAGTNFHTLTMASGVTEALPAGAPIRLVTKAAGAM